MYTSAATTSAPARLALRSETGFTLIEAMMAMTIFVIVGSALAGVLTASIGAHRVARERTLAQQHAMTQIEEIRAKPYDDVGTLSGNPPGNVDAVTPVAVTGLSATMRTRIVYVDDPTPTSYATSQNYKKVVVTITRDSDAVELAREVTYIAPSARAPYGKAILKVHVLDYKTSAPIPDANVSLATGPSGPRSDVTDTAGVVAFAGLTPNPTSGPGDYYDVTATAAGYAQLPDDLPPNPTAHVQLAPAQTADAVVRLYRGVSLTIASVDNVSGTPFNGPVTLYIGSDRAAETYAMSGGTLTVNTMGGLPLAPDQYTIAAVAPGYKFAPAIVQVLPDDYPNGVFTSSVTLRVESIASSKVTATVHVRSQAGAAVPNARVDVTGGQLPTYLTGEADAAGDASFDVPAGTAYTVKAWGANGEGIGQWSGDLTADSTVDVTTSG